MPLRRNRVAALIAMLAMALQALWPLVAQAKPRVPGIQVPLCTIEGITHYAELPAPDSPVERRSASHHEHCKMCVFGAEKVAFAASEPPPLALVTRADAPRHSLSNPLSSAIHRPALARAPPAPLLTCR